MHILHICSDYPFTPIYRELLRHLSANPRHFHTMYVPLPHGCSPPPGRDPDCGNVRVIYSADFLQNERMFYHRKRCNILRAIMSRGLADGVDLVHAHYLFSAGGVAIELKKRLGIPFVSAVRNSDLNYFFRYAWHLRPFGRRIMEGASNVVFLSPVYQRRIIETYLRKKERPSAWSRSLVLPSGIDRYWFENRWRRGARPRSPSINLLFVGELSRNKNVPMCMAVTDSLRRRGYDARLQIVGSGADAARIARLARRRAGYVSLRSRTESKEELRHFYRQADIFIMPSFTETFGLVYVEAMSQGLPIIYSRGQGIDGYFPEGTVGFACDPSKAGPIADRILDIVADYDTVSANCSDSIDRFEWGSIASRYEGIYGSVIGRTSEAA